jgi:HAMP domain-containing protein
MGEPVATIVEPVRDSNGRIRYYLSLDAELNWFSHLALAIPRYPGSMAAIVDSTGFILARQPDAERFAGAHHDPNETLLQMLGKDSGFVEGVGLDGIERLYAFRELPAANATQVLLVIGLPASFLYGNANRHLTTYLGLLTVMLILTVLMAWIAADLFVIRDVKALLGATERLADGDLSTRVTALSSSGELNDLALRFTISRGASRSAGGSLSCSVTRPRTRSRGYRVTRDRVGQRCPSCSSRRGDRGRQRMPARGAPRASTHRRGYPARKGGFDTGRRRESEQSIPTAEGESWIDLRVTPERNAAGEVTHAMVVAR